MSMTAAQVKDLITTLWTRVGTNRVDDADLRTVGNAIVDMVSALDIDIFPDWSSGLTFQTDGSDDGKYCKHPDTNGKKRIWETKTAANIGNEPPTDPLITSNTHWQEISQSAKSGIVEWSAGVYGAGLILVYYDHFTTGRHIYLLADPIRPFSSTDIIAEITAGKWVRVPDVYTKSEVDTLINSTATNTKAERVIRSIGVMGSTNVSSAAIKTNAQCANKTAIFVDVDVVALKTDGTASEHATIRSGRFLKNNSGTFSVAAAGTEVTSNAAIIASAVLEINGTNPQVKVTMGAASGNWEISWVAKIIEVTNA